MDGKHPNRKKDKFNPYTLTIENNTYYISFIDGQGNFQKQEISMELYDAFNRFELDDISWINEKKRHLTEKGISNELLRYQIADSAESLDDCVNRSMMYQKLYEAIRELPDIQRRRIRLYYFDGYTYEQIAKSEGCTHPAIIKSIRAAERSIFNSLRRLLL